MCPVYMLFMYQAMLFSVSNNHFKNVEKRGRRKAPNPVLLVQLQKSHSNTVCHSLQHFQLPKMQHPSYIFGFLLTSAIIFVAFNVICRCFLHHCAFKCLFFSLYATCFFFIVAPLLTQQSQASAKINHFQISEFYFLHPGH